MLSYYIYLLVITSSMLVCLILYKSVKKTALKYFLPFLVLTIIVELSGLWMNQHGIKNYLLFNVFTTVEFVFYSFLFFKHYRKNKNKLLSLLFMPLYTLAVIINLIYFQGIDRFHTYTFLLGSFFIVVFCCLFLYESVLPEYIESTLTKEPFFWVCTGLLLFYLGSVIINALFEYLRTFDMQIEGKKIYSTINQILNILLYTAFLISFIVCRNNNKTY
jgi:hypothetical protein